MGKFRNIHKHVKSSKKHVLALMNDIELAAGRTNDKEIMSILASYHDKITTDLAQLEEASASLAEEFGETLERQTQGLKKEIEHLRKTNDTVVSNNYLLEYKKKDLLLLADNLEEAYEEISQKNEELKEQKRHISEQAEKLRAAHAEILKKNTELEQQKEAMLDQTEYLHEANETISKMHDEVQKQKDEILKKNEELIDLNNEKNNLISIVAHDLKSPLNQMKGMISIIKLTNRDLDEDSLKYLDSIESSANRLNEMIGKILDIEVIEAQNLNLQFETVNISSIVTECIDRFRIVASDKDIAIKDNVDDNMMARVDKGFVNQVFENLISNAIKFSPQNKSVFVQLSSTSDKVLFEVRDEGPGLNEADKKKLFGKYQKLSARPTGNETSTGLGLSIVKKFVEAMEGEIWYESTEGEGAHFFVTFKKVRESQ